MFSQTLSILLSIFVFLSIDLLPNKIKEVKKCQEYEKEKKENKNLCSNLQYKEQKREKEKEIIKV